MAHAAFRRRSKPFHLIDVVSGAGLTFLFTSLADWLGMAFGSLAAAVFLTALAFYAAGFVTARTLREARPSNVGIGAACTVLVTWLARVDSMRSASSTASPTQIALFIAMLSGMALVLAWLGARFALILRSRRMSDTGV